MKISEENNSCVNVENNENDNDHSLFNKQSQEDSSANEISNLINQNNLDTIHMMKEIINLDDDNDDKNDSMRHKIKMLLRSNKFNMFLICLVKKLINLMTLISKGFIYLIFLFLTFLLFSLDTTNY